jgi:predicted transcriptional regulator
MHRLMWWVKTQAHVMPAMTYDTIETPIMKNKQVQTVLVIGQATAPRRDQMDIIMAILRQCREPTKKTHILFKVGLNFAQVSTYLQLLLRLKMLEEIAEPFEGYRIAEKGRRLLQLIGAHFSE